MTLKNICHPEMGHHEVTIFCEDCGIQVERRNWNHRFCKTCGKKHRGYDSKKKRVAYNKKYYSKTKKERPKYYLVYYWSHREEILAKLRKKRQLKRELEQC